MALFQDFSFSSSSIQRSDDAYIDPIDLSNISPRSSRSTSPFSASASPSTLSPSPSYMNLSQPISPLPSLTSTPSTPFSRHGPSTAARQSHSAQDFFATVRARRQSAVRLQCDPRRAANIRNYVERFLTDLESTSGSPTSSSRHPSSSSFVEPQHILPPTSVPSGNTSLSMHMMDCESEEDEAEDEAEALQALSLDDDAPGSTAGGVRRTSAAADSSLRLANGRRRRSCGVQKKVKGTRMKAGGRF